jgi:hypothetical protein
MMLLYMHLLWKTALLACTCSVQASCYQGDSCFRHAGHAYGPIESMKYCFIGNQLAVCRRCCAWILAYACCQLQAVTLDACKTSIYLQALFEPISTHIILAKLV